MISSPGLGSGLDVTSLVSQLVALEQQPLVRLAQREASIQGQISAFGALKSTLSTFQDSLASINSTSDFRVMSASSSDTEVFGATASSNASAGTFNLTVNRIAENHRLGSGTAFADADTTIIGTAGDTVTITQGADSFDIEFGGKTLAEVRDLINDASDNTGVSAAILQDDTGYRLLLNADETGSADFVSLAYSGADPFAFTDLNTDRDGDLSFSGADLDAEISVDGVFTATRTSNTITDVVENVTINLQAAGTSVLSVSENLGAVETAVQSFVDAYNTALETLKTLRNGALGEDSNSLFAMENQLRSALNTPTTGAGSFSSIYEIGISSTFVFGTASTENGKLNLDSSALRDALNEDTDAVAALFADADNGLIGRLESVLSSFVDFEGVIDGKTDSLNRQIDGISNRREVLNRRISSYEARLLAEFNALDGMVAQLQLSGNFLNQQLSLLQPVNSSN